MADELTIDQLAQRTRMTVRNIRAHQSRGLLPPPDLRGRTGYYGPDHVARLELIKELQADGFNLELIRRLVETGAGSSGELLRFTRALREPFGDEQPEVIDARTLAARWSATDREQLDRAHELGLLRALPDGRFEVRSRRLDRAGAQLAQLGVPIDRTLDVVAHLRRHADDIAEAFAELFVSSVWEPFERAGHPDARWPDVVEALERLRPLASESLLAVFGLAMDDVVEREFGRELERLRGEAPRAEAS